MCVRKFVQNSKHIFKASENVSLVIGNQTADLDSIVSSISLSFYMSKIKALNYIPIMNTTKSILKTKKECMFMLDFFSINVDDDLVYISDIENKKISQIILVDHNELDLKEKELNFEIYITGIIDHHLDKNVFKNCDPRIIVTSVGSCTSLITELYIHSKLHLDESIARMMLFSILSDTCNLKERTNKKDIESVEFLKNLANINLEILYEKIENLKFSYNLNNEDINSLLKKDYKQYEKNVKIWGISSVNFSVKELIKEKESLIQLKNFIMEKKLNFYAVLSCFKTHLNGFKRDIILFGLQSDLELIKSNLNCVDKITIFEAKHIETQPESLVFLLYEIEDVNLTRKFWQPILENILKF